MNEQLKIPIQFLTAGKSVNLEKQALFEMLMSAVLLGMETAERNLVINTLPSAHSST